MITPLGFQQRIHYFTDAQTGVLHEEVEKKDMAEMFMTNPDMMNGMMKQQLGGLGPQLALGAFVNYFFRGFILGKLPFPLSPKFRTMLQSGIDLPSLDVTYLSSLSYYMLLLFGSRGILTLFFQDVVNDAAMATQMQQQGMMMNPMMGGQDPQKQTQDALKAMDLLQHRWQYVGQEERAAQVLLSKLKRA
jgi:ER membrane protein complex subunit 3